MARTLRVYVLMVLLLAAHFWTKLRLRWTAPKKRERVKEDAYRRISRRIRIAATRLQGLYIKVGQLLSILANALPESFRAELEQLQDRVPPHPFEDIRRRLVQELGRPLDETFESIDETPIAAASIAQVHRAVTRDGRHVILKVQYPEIDRLVRTDLKTIRRIFGWLERLFPDHGWQNIYGELRAMLLAELDFRREAANLAAISANFQGDDRVAFPTVLQDLTTSRVLCATYEEGVKVSDREALAASGVNPTDLARTLIETYCIQIFDHGLYHADPHPGNLLVRKRESGPQIVFLDFGAVGRVSEDMKKGMANLVLAALANDTSRVVEALRTMGFVARTADPDLYHTIISFFHRKLQEEIQLERLSLHDIRLDAKRGLETLADLRDMDVTIGDLARQFHVPREWILLERTLLLLVGLCTELDPSLNPMEILIPYLKRFVIGDKDPVALLTEAAKDVLLAAVALPGELKHTLELLEQGRLQVRVRALEDSLRALEQVGRQLVLLGTAVAAWAFSLEFYDRGMARAGRWSATIGALAALWLLGSFLRPRRR